MSIYDNFDLIVPSDTNLIIKEYSDKITHLLISVPPSDDGDPFLNNFNKDLQSLKNLKWVGYLSATSVYGDHKGEFVNTKAQTTEYGMKGWEAKDFDKISQVVCHLPRKFQINWKIMLNFGAFLENLNFMCCSIRVRIFIRLGLTIYSLRTL